MLLLELYKGDSSGVISTSVYSDDTLVTDLTGYTGTFSIVAKVGDTPPLLEKEMILIDSAFTSQLTSDETTDLAIGGYIGVVEIENTGLEFRKESHISIVINEQGFI